jgi:pimeloyl-ACP methyl ester carboxylesterase
LGSVSVSGGATITLQDGRTLQGAFNYIGGVADDPLNPPIRAGGVDVKPILVINDGLRRTYVPKRHMIGADPLDTPLRKIHVEQRVANLGRPVAVVGAPIQIQPFDEFGRRTYIMNTTDGPLPFIQGITEITPIYTRVEAILGLDQPVIWDMRIATSSIPQETLTQVLQHTVPQDDPAARLTVVLLYSQSDRYRDARLELEQIIRDFPGEADLAAEVRELRQMGARRALEEIQLRTDAGQHAFVQTLLADFPAEEVAGETLVEVREMLSEYDARQQQIDETRERLKALSQALASDARAQRIAAAVNEISSELSHNTLAHLESFRQLSAGGNLSDAEKMSLALSGWLLGTSYATENLAVSLSLWEVRDLVRRYLREPTRIGRDAILSELESKEGASVEEVARILARMTPPLDPPAPSDTHLAGFYRLSIPGLAENPDVSYLVQLPPEYDPHRLYPTIVTLNGAGSTPELQLDFWAGGVVWQGEGDGRRGERLGQAARHGYITVSVDWQRPHQLQYAFSAREHHAVLSALRDVCRHFSVDTDRVFLTGHDIGGDAAWDIALAHPDLWAGVLPIVARADRYVIHYWPNAKYLPLYFVAGEFDGKSVADNARDFDRYLRGGFDCTLVEYLGRGHEAFHDEIQRMFDWMNRRRRQFGVREFACATMRPWDNFFWWLEVTNLPERSMIQPAQWPPPRNTRPLQVKGYISENGTITVQARGGKATVWLGPELVDFTKRHVVQINDRRVSGRSDAIEPSLGVLLEDARTRADRQHPFWAKIEGT